MRVLESLRKSEDILAVKLVPFFQENDKVILVYLLENIYYIKEDSGDGGVNIFD